MVIGSMNQLKKYKILFAEDQPEKIAKLNNYQIQKPKGPPAFPLIGHLPYIVPSPFLKMFKLSK